eukprot:12249421-Karenia_brevis.AAC.1
MSSTPFPCVDGHYTMDMVCGMRNPCNVCIISTRLAAEQAMERGSVVYFVDPDQEETSCETAGPGQRSNFPDTTYPYVTDEGNFY